MRKQSVRKSRQEDSTRSTDDQVSAVKHHDLDSSDRTSVSSRPTHRSEPAGRGNGDSKAAQYVGYSSAPDTQTIAKRYGIDIRRRDEAERVQRLESEFGQPRVSQWVAEGMLVGTMGKKRDMAAFRERQAGRPDEVPTDIERKNRASRHRNSDANSDGPAGSTGAPESVRNVVASPGTSMDESVQREMESKMGGEFSDVQLHTGPKAAAAADSINARAFTVGNHIAFNRGEYNPDSQEGKKVLAHELTHVRQQTAGRVSLLPKADIAPQVARSAFGANVTIQPKLELSSPNDPAEKEAEQVAQSVVEKSGDQSHEPGQRDENTAASTVHRQREGGSQTGVTSSSEVTIGGSVGHEDAEGSVEGSRTEKLEGENYNVTVEERAALNGMVGWSVEEVENADPIKYKFTLTVGLSGSLGGSSDGTYEINKSDKSLQGQSGTVSGGGEAGVSGGVAYSQTRVFGKEEAAKYQSHLHAIENTPTKNLLETSRWPEFGIIAKTKALMKTEPSKIAGGMAGVMGDPKAVDVLEQGESYSLKTHGGWNVSVQGEATTTASGLSVGIGGSLAESNKWEKTIEVERISQTAGQEIHKNSGGGSQLRTIVDNSLYFETGKSDPLAGEPAAGNQAVIDEITRKISEFHRFGSPESVVFDIAGHASQRWKAADGTIERQSKNEALSAERARQTKEVLKQTYTQETSSWPQPNIQAYGSLGARSEFPSGLDPTTDKWYNRRADVKMQLSEPEPDPEHSGKIRIKIGFSEASKSEKSGTISVGAASGGVSASTAEEESIVSTFEVYQSLDYFDKLYKSLVNVSSPEELNKIQQHDEYSKHWVGTELASEMEEMMGPGFEVGGAKVSLRYGGLSSGSWSIGKGGIKAGSGREAGQKFRVSIEGKGYDLFKAGTSYTAEIEKIPGGFEASVQEIKGFQTEHLSGTILSPKELSTVASRAENKKEWKQHVIFDYNRGMSIFAEETSLDQWEQLRQNLVNPDLSTLPKGLQQSLKTIRQSAKAVETEKQVDIKAIEQEFKNCVRANAIADFIQQQGRTGKLSIESMLSNWARGGDVGLPFEFPGAMSNSKEQLEKLRHVRVPAFVAAAKKARNSMQAGGEVPNDVLEREEKISDDITAIRQSVMANQEKFTDSENMAKLLGELDDMQEKVTEEKMAIWQIKTWDPETDSKDFGKMAIGRTIRKRRQSIQNYIDHFEGKVNKAYEYRNSLGDIFTSNNPTDILPGEGYFEEWGEQLNELKELYKSHPDWDLSAVNKYVCDDAVWDRYQEILKANYTPNSGFDPEARRQNYQQTVTPN